MKKRIRTPLQSFFLLMLMGSVSSVDAQQPQNLRSTTTEMRKAAALRKESLPTYKIGPIPPGTPNYFDVPNYANSPFTLVDIAKRSLVPNTGMRKFVDSLPGLGYSNRNNLGQYIPVAVPNTGAYSGSDYYELEVGQYSQQLHSDLPATTLRGYRQRNSGDPHIDTFQNLGPLVIAQRNKPVRIKLFNSLGTGPAGNLFLPVDMTVMGAGMGPSGGMYTENRAVVHLHGGVTPWISDGTPHQWITPAGEITPYVKGVSFQNVPGMTGATGEATYYYTNQQSSRLMFYHDHAYGITRLNVYAGEVAPYLLTDSVEEGLINSGVLPNAGGNYRYGIPLIIQDKTFVPPSDQLATQDPTWTFLFPSTTIGSLWFPHVYMPNQNPDDPCGCNNFGRWDYGPWFWPPVTAAAGLVNGPVSDPYKPSRLAPGTPNLSLVPEAFMDTPLVNGCAYPYLTVDRKPYRFRVLNGCNDRSLNLQLYYAVPLSVSVIYGGSGYTEPPRVTFKGDAEIAASGIATIENGVVTGIEITDQGSGYTTPPTVLFSGGGSNVIQARAVTSLNSDVKMVPACSAKSFPSYYPTPDSRAGGFPDPTMSGPMMIQIGTEGGFLPAPAVLPNTPIGYQYNRRDIVVLNVLEKTLLMGPAERADVIIDFSQVPDNVSYVILYNDAPAPVPAFDPRYDYYTNDPDMTDIGGAPSTIAGFGPNTRTVMQFRLTKTKGQPFNLTALQNALPTAFAASQPVPVVLESTYPAPYQAPSDTYSRIQDNALTFTPFGGTGPITVPMLPKAIQELFELNYGRMNAILGSELPFTNGGNQTTVPLGYRDPPVENLVDNEIQLWKITHNGVDTHAIHFHLFNVQLINRVGWDGTIRAPDANELGWKETVRMNPLEDTIVALRPIGPTAAFAIPNSVRFLDPTMGSGATWSTFDPLSGAAVTITNTLYNFGNEYVWHCHLLGHEENDMMRPMTFNLAPGRPTITGIVAGPTGSGQVNVTFTAPSFPGTLGPITSYTVTSIPNPFSFGALSPVATSPTAGTVTVNGLSSGVTYTFYVEATSGVTGQSVTSQPSYILPLAPGITGP